MARNKNCAACCPFPHTRSLHPVWRDRFDSRFVFKELFYERIQHIFRHTISWPEWEHLLSANSLSLKSISGQTTSLLSIVIPPGGFAEFFCKTTQFLCGTITKGNEVVLLILVTQRKCHRPQMGWFVNRVETDSQKMKQIFSYYFIW